MVKKAIYRIVLLGSVVIGFSAWSPFCFSNTNPVGFFDVMDANGNAAGWALDPDAPAQAIRVDFYVDNPAGAGIFIGSTTANLPRPDVNLVTKYPGDHGFNFQLPQQYLSGYHSIYAYAIDTAGGNNPQLSNSPKTIGTKPSGDTQISGTVDGSPLVIKTCERTAGAICSITWKGKEFVNTTDHGRELQSASSFDGYGECFNPTEAGSNDDGTGSNSTSVLRSIGASGNMLETQTQMAFWLKPGEVDTVAGNCGVQTSGRALNQSPLSNHVLNKTVTIGFDGMPNVIEYLANFTVAENHSSGTFEAATGYMPPEFSSFWTYDPATKVLATLSDGPGEEDKPTILATPDGNYAMGIYSPDLPQGAGMGYARWKFINGYGAGATVKWDCVFREGAMTAGQTLHYRCYPIVGTLKDVTVAMDKLYAKYPNNSSPFGFFDSADCNAFSGWACDANDYSSPLAVHFYSDGQAGSGGTFLGAATANTTREATVGSLCGGNKSHGFSFATPASLKDGKSHTIYAYAINIPAGSNPLLGNNAKLIQCSAPVCTNDCQTIGAAQCVNSGVQTCAQSGNCLKWSAAVACAGGQTCQNGVCAATCTPKTCSSLNYNCGAADDGCGQTLSCGTCLSSQNCTNNTCVASCTAQTCASFGYVCGSQSDGCGGTLSCGTCDSGKICSAGVCAATSSGGGSGGGGGSSSGGGGNTNPPVQSITSKPEAQMTRAQILAAIAKIQALIADLQKQLAALTGSTTTFSCIQITKNLFYGMANDPQAVRCLQEVLISQGYAVTASGNYDATTKTAVAQFQQKYAGEILAPYHLTRGSGNVGNATRAKINSLTIQE